MASSCECGNEHLTCRECNEFLDGLRNDWILRTAPWSYLDS